MAKHDQPLGAPRPGNRMLDLVVLICLIAAVAFLLQQTGSPAKKVSESPAPTPAPGARMAPPFELPEVGGGTFQYEGGKGPALIVLTAVGCAGCRDRVGKIDKEAYEWARSNTIPVWNIFVYANVAAAAAFQAEMAPVADRFLADSDGAVSVGAYKGSDESCWILIGPAGDILWQGGTDLAALEKAYGGQKVSGDGVQIEVLQEGSGPGVTSGPVTVHYTGWLEDGKKFDSSVDRGQPFEFNLGAGQVIKGWEQGVVGMKVGEKRKLTIPPSLGYGEQGAGGSIPPNATLIFEVERLGKQ